MANEAILSTRLQDNLPEVTVADGVLILKGTVLALSDPNTGAASTADGDIFAGIAFADKVASDGATKLATYTQGIFDMTCDGTGVTVGDYVKIGGANLISTWTGATEALAGDLEKLHFGIALQTGAASEVILVRLI